MPRDGLTQVLALLCALLAGALARDLLVAPVRAEEDALRRSDVTAIVRALERQADATKELVRATRAMERCR